MQAELGLFRSLLRGLLLIATTACFVLGGWMYLLAEYEDQVFGEIARDALKRGDDREPVLSLLHAAHELVEPRYAVSRMKPYANPLDSLFRAPLYDLVDGRGACGSYATVLARLLQVSDIQFRMVQLNCKNAPGCHMFVEAEASGDWVLLDAMYDLSFRTSEGKLAGVKEVGVERFAEFAGSQCCRRRRIR